MSRGSFEGEGTIESPKFTVSSHTGLVRVTNLKVLGDCYFAEASTLILPVAGTNLGQYSSLNVTGDLVLESLVYLKLNGYDPRLGDLVDFLSYKTGTISGISSLSGYLYPKDFKDIIFSIIINESSDLATSQVRKAIDSIIVQCAMLESNCDDEIFFQ